MVCANTLDLEMIVINGIFWTLILTSGAIYYKAVCKFIEIKKKKEKIGEKNE
jgi:hypothetical protein